MVMDLLGFRGLILAIGYSAEPGLTVPSIASPATFTVSLQVETSSGVPSSTTTKTVYQQSTLITKPLASDYFKTISIFLYSPPVPASVPSGVTTPCATVLNRVRVRTTISSLRIFSALARSTKPVR